MSLYSPRDQRIIDWQNASKEAKAATAKEAELRRAVFAECFPAAEVGTNNLELGKGFKLKGVRSLSYKLANGEGQTEQVVDLIGKLGNEGSFIADRLVKWKPELSVSEYKAIAEKANAGDLVAKRIKDLIDSVLTVTDAMPTLEVAEPRK